MALHKVTYQGRFVGGATAAGPLASKVNCAFQLPEVDPKAKAPAKGMPVVPDNAIGAVAGAPLPATIAVLAQAECAPGAYPPPPPADPAAPPPPPPAGRTIVSDAPAEGRAWATAVMEQGRRVSVTLHRGPPGPAPEDQPCSVLLSVVRDEADSGEGGEGGGSVAVALSILQGLVVGPPLALSRDASSGEALTGLRLTLANGAAELPGLVLGGEGAPLDGPLTALFSTWALPPATVPIVFPDAAPVKGKK